MKKYNLAVCGGTFDLLHLGHKKFLSDILEISENILIGLTSDSYVFFKNLEIQKFEFRKKELKNFLDSIKMNNHFEIVSIDDVYGPLLDKALNFDVLIVTPETIKGALEINKKRKEVELSELPIEIVEMGIGIDGEIISSTRIRGGNINREGRVYFKEQWKKNDLILPYKLRDELSRPAGKVLKDFPEDLIFDKVITIGDETTKKFNEKFGKHFLSIVDYQVQRLRKYYQLSELGFTNDQRVIEIQNSAGRITSELSIGVQNVFENKNYSIILVDGEEDLAVLPVVLMSPLGFKIYYGQPNEGLIEINVTEDNKEKAYKLINQFSL